MPIETQATPDTDADLEDTLRRIALLLQHTNERLDELSWRIDALERQLAESQAQIRESLAVLSARLDGITAQTIPPEPIARKRRFDLRSLWPWPTKAVRDARSMPHA